jgi:hypothetical protein
VVPPLLQGSHLSVSERVTFALELEKSEDAQIRIWPSIRSKQRQSQKKSLTNWLAPALAGPEYQAKLQTAIAEDHKLAVLEPFDGTNSNFSDASFSMVAGIAACESEIEMATGERPKLVLPFGSLEARIGIILDYGPVSINKNNEGSLNNITVLPWGIKESGFTESNSLIWTFNLRQHCVVRATDPAKLSDSRETRDRR